MMDLRAHIRLRRKRDTTQKGFTLIEIIAVILIVGLLTAVAGLGIVQIARGFVLTRASGEIALKSEFVLTRLRKSIRNLTDVTVASPASLTMTRIEDDGAQVVETFTFGADNLTLNGVSLMSGISGSFSYSDEDSNTWEFGDDLGNLAEVMINFAMQGPENSALNFSESILPRNTFTPDRIYTPSGSGTTAAQGLCLLETIYPDTPLVWQLFRNFRDSRLQRMPLGKPVIKGYYRVGSQASNFINAHPRTRHVAGWVVAPLVAILFFLAYFPVGLLALLAAAWLIGRMVARLLAYAPTLLVRTPRYRRVAGSILMSLAVTMTILAILGGALVSVLNTAQGTGVSSALGEQAYYFAESGLRYAVSRFMAHQDEDDQFISDLSEGAVFDVTGSGGFRLAAQCFYFDPVSGDTLQSYGDDFPAEIVDTIVGGGLSGYLEVRDAGTGNRAVVSVTIDGINHGSGPDTIDYTNTSGLTVSTSDYVLPVTTVDGATSQLNGIQAADFGEAATGSTITIDGLTSFFPPVRGLISFMADADNDGSYDDEVFLIYERKDGSTLRDLRNVPGKNALPTAGIDIQNNTPIVLGRYARLKSTGVVAEGTRMESKAELTLHQPLDVAEFMKVIYNTEAAEQHVEEVLGQHQWNADEGALQVTETEDTYFAVGAVDVSVQESLAAYDWEDAGWSGSFLEDLWERSGRKLSYETQVKVKFTDVEDDDDSGPVNHPGNYMPGIAFRLRYPDSQGATFYGMSFTRGVQGTTTTSSGCGGPTTASDDDDIPDNLYAGNSTNSNPPEMSTCPDSDFTPTEWNDDPMLDGIPYLLFWQKYIEGGDYGCGSSANNSPFEWLSYMPLVEAEKTMVYRYDSNEGVSVYGGTLLGGAWADHQADFPVGEYTRSECEAMGMQNDDIEAVAVKPGFRVTIYEDDNFGGASRTLTSDQNLNLVYISLFPFPRSWGNEVSSLIVEYTGSDTLKAGWYDGQVSGFTADETYAAWKLTDKYNLFKTYSYDGDDTILTLGKPGAVTIMDPATAGDDGGPYPVQNTAYIVFPGDTGDSDQANKRDLNYRLYLKEWVTVGLQIFELEGDLDCNTATGDSNGEERINAVSAFFGAPESSGTNPGDNLKDGARAAYASSTVDNYSNYPVKWIEDKAYFTRAMWDGLGIDGSDAPVFPTDGGYTSMMVDNPYDTDGCVGDASEIKLVEKGLDADDDPTIVYTGTLVTEDYQSYFDNTGISVPEIGLHTLGVSAASSAGTSDTETAYFKDWYWRFFEGGQTGMIPGVVSE
ncbi:MAG: prepilin-type N-terminal cleavage/methylation domain-containing protein [Thermodesulfobacteriota bacterium]|nr:prepilin-type N-terminal cleavage/methylation domain-containing protein [Thermodesulfobacteriota bacterium]